MPPDTNTAVVAIVIVSVLGGTWVVVRGGRGGGGRPAVKMMAVTDLIKRVNHHMDIFLNMTRHS